MSWQSLAGPATRAKLVMVDRLLAGWDREQRIPEFLLRMLIDNFIDELRDAKKWLEKELARKN